VALERLDPVLRRGLEPLVARLPGVDPNAVTWLGAGTGVLAAGLLWVGGAPAFGAAAALVALSYVLDVLDGQLARAHGKESRWGDYLDHALDRVVDSALLLAVAYDPACMRSPVPGLWATVATLLGSYLGTQAQASGLSRDYAGFSRTDRLALLGAAAALAAVGPNLLGPAVIACGLGGAFTFLARGWRARGALTRPGPGPGR
jgi:archaetidylinositol phosphate synthase